MSKDTAPAGWPNPWPGPIDPTQLTSPAYRAERSRALAEWVGLPADALEGFVERMELSWMRQQAYEHREAERRLREAEKSRRQLEAKGDLVMLRNRRLTRLRPRRGE